MTKDELKEAARQAWATENRPYRTNKHRHAGAKEGAVILVEFTIAGLSYQALNGGPH